MEKKRFKVLTGITFTDEELYEAYRKAKADVYYERSQPMAVSFCEYETKLHERLSALSKRLRKGSGWATDEAFIGTFGYIPKGMQLPPEVKSEKPRLHFNHSDPEEAWKHKVSDEAHPPKIAFRPIAHFSVDMYVICALWVNLVGHKYDACLDNSAKGSRLKRLRPRQINGAVGNYHGEALGSFKPYIHSYREWRGAGLRAIRDELEGKRRVVAITMDLAGFYHNIDPSFLLNNHYLEAVKFDDHNPDGLGHRERALTKSLITAFSTWASKLPGGMPTPPGVPVGPSASSVIANVVLAEFDRLVQENLSPVYYGRYVDDIFLVLRDSGGFATPEKLIDHLCERITPLNMGDASDYSELRLEFEYAGESDLKFKTEKQRVFMLEGPVGEDLLDAIESKIDEVSSEWRLLPDLADLERSPAARVLTATRTSHEEADSLRKADDLSLRRLSFALLLRSVSSLARDLPPEAWASERQQFYKFAHRHVLTPLRILDLNDYLARLLALAVSCRDSFEADRIVTRVRSVLESVRSSVQVESPGDADEQWEGYYRHLKQALIESFLRAYQWGVVSKVSKSDRRTVANINAISDFAASLEIEECRAVSESLFVRDLGRNPFKDFLLGEFPGEPSKVESELAELPKSRREKAATIREFLDEAGLATPTMWPLLFPTRPLSAPEVTELWKETASNLDDLARIVNALRGSWVKPYTEIAKEDAKRSEKVANESIVEIGTSKFRANQNRAD